MVVPLAFVFALLNHNSMLMKICVIFSLKLRPDATRDKKDEMMKCHLAATHAAE